MSALAGLAAGGWWLASAEGAPPPRDVLIILLDAVRSDALGCYGRPGNPTPNLDRFARDGVLFARSYASSAWTLPSTGSLLTGTWPTVHGGMGQDENISRIRNDVPTGPEVMRRRGFWTAGLANAAYLSPLVGLDRGFDHFDARYTFNRGSRRADETVDAFLPLLDRATEDSRFFFLHLFDAHLSYDPPGRFAQPFLNPPPPLNVHACLQLMNNEGATGPGTRYVRDVYQAEISFIDEQLGRLFADLKRTGRYDDALIIVTADHGEEFRDHGGFEHGHTLYDELVRVPLILKLPRGTGPAGTTVKTQVRSIDIMPTIFELTHLDPPDTFIGRSLVPLLHGQREDDRPVLLESTLYGTERIALNNGRHKVIVTGDPNDPENLEVYDFARDPGETRNLAGVYLELTTSLRRELDLHRRDLYRRIETYSSPRKVNLSPANVDHLKSLGYLR